MKLLYTLILSVIVLLGSLSLATASTKEQQLQEILQLLDRELAERESTQTDSDHELDDAVTTIYGLGITKFSTPSTYMADNPIRRDEAATMLYRLADTLDLLGEESDTNCRFADISQAHSDLINVVTNSCRYGLFQGDGNRFLPTASITNAQALTVLTRMLDGNKSEDTGGHWALNYYDYMRNEGYTTGLAANSSRVLDKTITRSDIAIMLARVYEEME